MRQVLAGPIRHRFLGSPISRQLKGHSRCTKTAKVTGLPKKQEGVSFAVKTCKVHWVKKFGKWPSGKHPPAVSCVSFFPSPLIKAIQMSRCYTAVVPTNILSGLCHVIHGASL